MSTGPQMVETAKLKQKHATLTLSSSASHAAQSTVSSSSSSRCHLFGNLKNTSAPKFTQQKLVISFYCVIHQVHFSANCHDCMQYHSIADDQKMVNFLCLEGVNHFEYKFF